VCVSVCAHVVVRRQTPKTVAEQVTSVIPRERPRGSIPQPGNLALPIQTTVTPRKRPSASNPQTPVTGAALLVELSAHICVCLLSVNISLSCV